jgi:hypothetical protein
VRVEGVRLANLVAQTAEVVLPAETAARFLATFRQEVARAAARRAAVGPGAAPADAGDPTDPDVPTEPADPADAT